jgi:phage terminase small subunit
MARKSTPKPTEAKATTPEPNKAPAKRPAAKKVAAKPKKPAGVAQQAERRPSKSEVPGSTPGARSKKAKPAQTPAETTQKLLQAEPAPDPQTGLHPRVQAFADEYLRDLNGTAAYLRVHPTASVRTAGTESWRLLKNPEVRAYVAQRRERLALEVDFSKADIIRELVALTLADPNELTQMRHVSCEECWPEEKDDEGKPVRLPMWQEPNPECLHCQGEGIPRPWFADTRKLSPAARRLFSSVYVTKEGTRIQTRDQDAALDKLAKILGAYELDNQQKGGALADALASFAAEFHGQGGGRLKPVPRAPKEPTKP